MRHQVVLVSPVVNTKLTQLCSRCPDWKVCPSPEARF